MNVTEVPAQIAPDGLAAIAFVGTTLPLTATTAVPKGLVHPATVTVTLYVPAIANVEEGREGSSNADVKALGPVQAYVAPANVFEVNSIVEPVHTGELLPAIGAAGIGFTTIETVPAKLEQPPLVTVNEYVPPITVVTLVKAGGFLTAAA